MMSSGVKGGAGRVSIPAGVKKTIENIKEITGQNHSEDDIYAMLKECSMDPNETAQKLLLLDTFHEVKSKRDRRKESQNKESAEMKWKPGIQQRANRGGRGNYSSRYTSHDVSGGRNSAAIKENASILNEKSTSKAPLAASQGVRKKENSSVASPIIAVSNGATGNTFKSSNVIHVNHASGGGVVSQPTAILSKLDEPVPLSTPIDSIENPITSDKKDSQSNNAASIPSAPASGTYFSTKDPVLLASRDSPLPSAVGIIQSEVGNQHATAKPVDDNPTERKAPAEATSEVGKTQHLETMQNASSTVGVPAVSRPSSNYNNRSQVIGPQKVGPGKAWKPKSINPNNGEGASAVASLDVSMVSAGSHPESQTIPVVFDSKDATLELQRNLEDSHISDNKHVIIPNHLHVPKEKLGFCFGSFDASFGLNMDHYSAVVHDKSPPLSESSEAIDESVKEPELSNQNALVASEDIETKHLDQPQSPPQGQEKISSNEVELSSTITPDYGEAKPEAVPGSHQHPMVHGSSNYNFGFMPPILSGQLTPLESSESQARDAPRLPGFVVPQSFDPASYYAQFYRPGSDDGRISPFHSSGAANKYNGNAMVSAQTSQAQELQGGVPLVLSTASPTPLVTQAAGVMQSSIPANQQPLPVFRQPTGVHLPHYPPNYLQYGPYFSPFYVPPPAIHQFLSNGAYPQQPPQSVSLYPNAPVTTAKYSASQFKQGSNTGSSTHMGVPGSYAPYCLSMANYTSSPVTSAVNATSNEDVGVPQVKEKNLYVSGQQVNSFYNLPQGQLAFAPTQPGHGTFTGVFHPAQAVTAANVHPLLQQSQAMNNPIDMVGPTANVYQQPQHAQINWPSNY